ncbi:hypothetical protein ACUTQ5_13485 [Serratia sp. NA_112.1]|uniref:hypothetical protein n=1 Tax=Serratia sp. NA_112.1 TaxID=3415665 RepID=UPI0040468C83
MPLNFPLMTPPARDAASYVLMDYTTGQVLAQENADQRRNPASLTKLMTGLVIDHALDHKIGLDDVVPVGKDAWAEGNPVFKGSSLMFLKPGDRVTVRDLSRGIIIASATEGDRRLIAVVMGGKSSKGRKEQARKLLTWGLRDFVTLHLFSAGQSLGQEKVWDGDRHEVAVGSRQDQYLSLPKSEADKLKAQYVIKMPRLDAPLAQGQPVKQGGMFSSLMDYVKLKV